ncbi:hypothetical protein Sbal625DRAFT_3100 [Shewanella baltica OS625]|nr:hypothetical protein Sbal625DRAFT_3100 [Shewanella baltica OS625]
MSQIHDARYRLEREQRQRVARARSHFVKKIELFRNAMI